MAVIVKSDRITFPGGDQTAPGVDINTLKAMVTNTSPVHGGVAWGSHYNWDRRQEAQNVRGRYYVSRSNYAGSGIQLADGYGNIYYSNGYTTTIGNDSVTFANNTGYALKVNVRAWAGRWTDDTEYHSVWRGGSISNNYTHSGGTQIINTNSNDTTYVDTIPANTSYTYYHYCGLPGGSGGDQLNAYFTVSFNTWV